MYDTRTMYKQYLMVWRLKVVNTAAVRKVYQQLKTIVYCCVYDVPHIRS